MWKQSQMMIMRQKCVRANCSKQIYVCPTNASCKWRIRPIFFTVIRNRVETCVELDTRATLSVINKSGLKQFTERQKRKRGKKKKREFQSTIQAKQDKVTYIYWRNLFHFIHLWFEWFTNQHTMYLISLLIPTLSENRDLQHRTWLFTEQPLPSCL